MRVEPWGFYQRFVCRTASTGVFYYLLYVSFVSSGDDVISRYLYPRLTHRVICSGTIEQLIPNSSMPRARVSESERISNSSTPVLGTPQANPVTKHREASATCRGCRMFLARSLCEVQRCSV